MDRIECMDLKRQYEMHKEEFMSAIAEVCENTAFSGGLYTEKFEREFAEYIGTKYCSCVNSGTSALHMAMLALGIGSGDEVIVPANTFIASAWGVVHAGATPVFVDCFADTWEIDDTKIEEKITERTKAVVGVHLYGQPFDADKVKEITQKHQLYLIEDCAQAHGALYKGRKAGTLGDIGCFSFYPGKNLGAFGEGGAITTNQIELYETVNLLKNHGCKVRYHHECIGYNMRMDGIQAAILSVKLKYLDEWNGIRNKIAAAYTNKIDNAILKLQYVPKDMEPVYHLFEIQVDDYKEFMEYMQENNIYCARHYPVPCHLQKAFEKLNYQAGAMPETERLADHCVSLPMYPEMTSEEVEKVIRVCNRYKKSEE